MGMKSHAWAIDTLTTGNQVRSLAVVTETLRVVNIRCYDAVETWLAQCGISAMVGSGTLVVFPQFVNVIVQQPSN